MRESTHVYVGYSAMQWRAVCWIITPHGAPTSIQISIKSSRSLLMKRYCKSLSARWRKKASSTRLTSNSSSQLGYGAASAAASSGVTLTTPGAAYISAAMWLKSAVKISASRSRKPKPVTAMCTSHRRWGRC